MSEHFLSDSKLIKEDERSQKVLLINPMSMPNDEAAEILILMI